MKTFWVESHDGEPTAFQMARRHYSAEKNKKPKQRQFVGPGEHLVLIGFMIPALFAWRKSRFRADGQKGVECTIFRNESDGLSSEMIREAMALAWKRWPGERLFTFVNPAKIKSINPGCCFRKAGWKRCGKSKRGYIIFEAVP
jgi:hypothetical protein